MTTAEPKKEETTAEEQIKILEDAKTKVKTEAFYMKRCLDQNNLIDALKHASNMVGELRTSMLGPKNYYALYIEAFDQLRHLENYLIDEKSHGKKMSELYELVQYAGNVLPRLYLVVTVGSAYIRSKEVPAKDVLRDLVEMCRGVQHPTRGLFLRTYLSECVKDKLPDTGSEYEGRGGNVKDSIDFVLVNFTEMNKLWVRLQHQAVARDKEKREQERAELKLLVGKNISRLSQLEGVDVETYKNTVLPKILEQIVSCKDIIAQQYLMECIIHAFPDDFHLRTLEPLLNTFTQLQSAVNIKQILVALIERLASFAQRGEYIPAEINVFQIFSNQIAEILNKQTNMSTEDILALQASLALLSITCYPTQLGNVDQVIKFSADLLEKRAEDHTKQSVVRQVMRLLSTPLESFKNVLTVLQLVNYPRLLAVLAHPNRKKVALDLSHSALDYNTTFTTAEQVSAFLDLIQPLVREDSAATPGTGGAASGSSADTADQEDFEEEQNAVGSLVHLFDNPNPETLFAMYYTARNQFGLGGPRRIKHTLPPLVFRALRLTGKIKAAGEAANDEGWGARAQKVFKFIHETVKALSKTNFSEISLKLFLQAALAASKCGASFETIAYEFVTQAFLIYEEHVADSTAQYHAILNIIGTLHNLTVFSEENYDTLITKTALYSSKLLRKPDQCRAIYSCSHLFWRVGRTPEYRNGKRVLECLQRALKIADTCMDSSMNVHLFVEILNEYLYYFDTQCDAVMIQYLSGLIALINTNMANMDNTEPEHAKIQVHYQNTLNFIRSKKETDPKYAEIEV